MLSVVLLSHSICCVITLHSVISLPHTYACTSARTRTEINCIKVFVMGVPDLWQLLQDAATQIPPMRLAGKRLAVDASIWLYRDATGRRDQSNGHIETFLGGIVNMHQHGIYPVFVFDGRPPEKKRRILVRWCMESNVASRRGSGDGRRIRQRCGPRRSRNTCPRCLGRTLSHRPSVHVPL
jgi:hypothetical protein